jgi:hypothetical protein
VSGVGEAKTKAEAAEDAPQADAPQAEARDANPEGAATDTDGTAPSASSEGPNEGPYRAPPKEDVEDDIVFQTLWGRVLEAWDDEKTHSAMLSYAINAQKLPELAGRYRDIKADPVKGALADKKVGAIVLAATQMLMSTKSQARPKIPISFKLTLIGIMVVVLGYLFLVLGRSNFTMP